MFNHERLEVYRIALEFDQRVAGLGPWRGHRALKDQLDRASMSILACIAEGAGRTSPKDKQRFYAIARGSATECVAHLDAMKNRKLIPLEQYSEGRRLLLSVVRILSRLCRLPPTPPAPAPAPEPGPYT